ncbi:hypothetical protein LJC23_05175, partial [Desulfovibrio sp. OttesenSCG-928-I05]|nr:hypothetical protein [Desulfovibrio sp. OttesenSCG-928-I05]
VVSAGTPVPVMLTDISMHGMQLTLPPGAGVLQCSVNAPVVMSDFPETLATFLDGITGTIAWLTEQQCGVKLDDPLPHPAEVIAGFAAM